MFENGISDFVDFKHTVDIHFPVDSRGKSHICCKFCNLFTGTRCVLTWKTPLDAEKFVAEGCPIEKENDANIELEDMLE